MSETTAGRTAAGGTVLAVIAALSFCHMLNDMMQSLLPAIYPMLKTSLDLNFGQIGLVTLAFQVIPAGAARRIDAPSPGNCAF